MTTVSILPERTDSGETAYRAIAGERHSVGKTAGAALDALSMQLPQEETGTLVVVQQFRADQFFTAAQQTRLGELMERWRLARASGSTLLPTDQAELGALVEAELQAAGRRASAMIESLGS